MLAAFDPQTFIVHLLNGLTLGGIYVLIAIGLSLIFGVMNIVNFAHGSLWMLGAYITVSVVGMSTGSFWIALLAAPLLVGAVGVGMEVVTFRPIYGRNPLYHILLTFGFTLVFADIVEGIWGTGFRTVRPPELLLGAVQVGPELFFPKYRLFVLGATIVLSLGVWALLKYTTFGLIIRAGSQNRLMSRSLGVNVSRYYTLVFALGAALAGIAGVLSAPIFPIVPTMWSNIIIIAFIVVIIGGLGSFRGAVAAGFLVGLVESLGQAYVSGFSGYIVYALMFAVLLIRPQGIFGREGYQEETEAEIEIDESLPTISGRSPIFLSVVAVLVIAPLVVTAFFSSYYIGILTQALALGIFALGLDLATGYTGLISFGHAAFLGLGAYVTMLVLLNVTGLLPVAIVVAVVVATLVAWLTGYLGIRVSGVYFAMLTLAVAEMFHQLSVDLETLTGGTNGLGMTLPAVPLVNLGDTMTIYYIALAVIVALYLLAVRILESPFGTSLIAIRDSEHRMRALGYDVDKYKRRAFALSGAYGGIAGVIYALFFTFISPGIFSWTTSGDVIVMMILGGMGTLYGPIFGAGVFVVLENILSTYVAHWELLLGVLLIAVVIFAPRGLVSIPIRLSKRVREGTFDQVRRVTEDPEETKHD
jgi:branched-chain amino acid transport system permease protein